MKVLTSPSSFGQVGPEPFDLLKKNGFEIINNPYGRKLTEDEVITLAKDCIGIVAGVEPLTAKVLDALTQLKVISRVGVGLDSVDINHAKSKGIVVTNTPDGPTRAVAELTLAMTFSLLRKIPQADSAMKKKEWKKQTGNLLHNKVIGVIGLGRIGRMVTDFFRGLGNEVIAYDPFADNSWAESRNVTLMNFEEVLRTSDILTLHIPGNSDGTAVIAEKELSLMKKSSLLINISRGGIVDEKQLYDSLKNGKIKGAAIDVFVNEPYSGPLTELENVVLTPHLGSYAEEGKLLMEIAAVENLVKSLN